MSATPAISSTPPVIARVHGTGADQAEDAGKAWWQCRSPVEAELAKRLKGAAECEQAAFHWTGSNTESAVRRLPTLLR